MFVTRDKIRRHLVDEYDRTQSAESLSQAGVGCFNAEQGNAATSSGTNGSSDKNAVNDDDFDEIKSPTNVSCTDVACNAQTNAAVSKVSVSEIPASVIVREPAYWNQHLENIREMRAKRDAPVDTMGAEACADPEAQGSIRRYQILTSLMLSSQTKDEATSSAMKRLRAIGCTPESISKIPQSKLADLLYPVGFFSRKAEYVKKVADILVEKFHSDIPSTYEELCALPGVGPKMATLTMNLAWRKNSGVGVDTHVHRIANRLGWTLSATKTPEATEKALNQWLPRDLWDDINLLFVGFGQQICTPIKPKCEDCLNQSICPYAMRN